MAMLSSCFAINTANNGHGRVARMFGVGLIALVMAACSGTKGGAYYDNDGPGSRSAEEFLNAPDATPLDEPIVKSSTRPYVVFGKQYVPLQQRRALTQNGNASWYGKQFHGRLTSIGEKYDMYAMTAAHPTLPLPSYVNVVNRANGRSVVVRVNDRGPFLNDRIIDLSFAAAAKLGYVEQGTAPVSIDVVDPVVVTLRGLRERLGLRNSPSDLTDGTVAGKTTGSENSSAAALPTPPAGAALTIAAPNRVLLAAAAQAQPGGTGAAPAAQVAEPIVPVKLADRALAPVAAIEVAPTAWNDRLEPFVPGPVPIVEIEALEGKGLRPARPEAYKLPPVERPPLNLAATKKTEDFVIPYKHRLPKEQKGGEPAKVYLQLGSYETEKAAREALTMVGSGLQWLREPVNLLNERGLHKLQAGPFASSRKAQETAKRIRRQTDFSPFYVFR